MKRFPTLIILILLFGMFVAVPPTPVVADTEHWVDWVIDKDTTVTGETIVVHSDVIVENGSALTLNNCVLKIDSIIPGNNGIKVEAGGGLYVYNTTITAYLKKELYIFGAYGDLEIENSDISCMFNWGIGLFDTKDVSIKNSRIHDNGPYAIGITVDNSTGMIVDNDIYNNLVGIVSRGDASVEISGNNIRKNQRGISCRGDSRIFIKHNYLSDNSLESIEVMENSVVDIADNTIDSNCDGICCFDTSIVSITGNVISKNSERGIDIEDNSVANVTSNIINSNKNGVCCFANATVNIIGNIISKNSERGINAQRNALVNVANNTISYNNEAVCSFNDAIVDITKNTVTNNYQGIYAEDRVEVSVTDNIVAFNNKGFNVLGRATVCIINNQLSSNRYGVVCNGLSIVKIYNCTITDSIEYDVWAENCSRPTIVNTNFDLNKLSFSDTESIISIGHWLDVNVKNKNNVPVQNAEITIKNKDGAEVFNGSTDYDGHVSCIPMVEYDLDYMHNYTDRINYTPHTVYASKLGKTASEKISIDMNRIVNFTLDISDKLAHGNLITAIVEGHEVVVEYSGNGTVTIEPVKTMSEIPENIKGIGIFFDLKIDGEVEEMYITVRYSEDELEGVNEAGLRMYCYLDPGEYDPGEYDPGEYDPGEYDPGEYGGWVMIKNSGVDIHSNIVWAKVSHTTIFSPMARETSKQTDSGTTATWLWYSSIVAVLAIILLIFISVMMKKRVCIGSNKKTKRRINL